MIDFSLYRNVRTLVTIACVGTLLSVGLMVLGFVVPHPLMLVLSMSLGQLLGVASLALYLLAIALDLRGVSAELARERDDRAA
ncbi:MAG TPA: hypothetical protein VD838_03260 [Anaeromyxobacteraceae bacterium]|nr:hypothetical protein [Anaeromyxobacteraceae bacterium]